MITVNNHNCIMTLFNNIVWHYTKQWYRFDDIRMSKAHKIVSKALKMTPLSNFYNTITLIEFRKYFDAFLMN